MRVTSHQWLAIGVMSLALVLVNRTTAQADTPPALDSVAPVVTTPATPTPVVVTPVPPVTENKATAITGSNLPQQYRRNGRITDTALNVIVIDHNEIERSGATSLAGLLHGVAGIRIGGR